MNTKNLLPTYIDPIKFAQQGVSIEGYIPLSQMTDIAEDLAHTEGQLIAHLDFGVDHEGFCFLKGKIEGELALRCQRCMQIFHLPLNLELSLSPVKDEKASKRLPSYYDPLPLTEESLLLKTILEEEIILSLPLVAKHDSKDCPVKTHKISLTGEKEPVINERKSPFEILKKIKSDN